MDARLLQKPERCTMRFRYPGRHAFRIGRKFEFDRSRALKAGFADRIELFAKGRVAAAGRHVAVIGAIAIRHVNMRNAALQSVGNLLGREEDEPPPARYYAGNIVRFIVMGSDAALVANPDARLGTAVRGDA